METEALSNFAENKLLLAGKRILITRYGEQAESFARQLKELGAEPILLPVIKITEPDSWQELDDAIANISKYSWIFFASANAVVSFIKRLGKDNNKNAAIFTSLDKIKIAVIGRKTAMAVENAGLKVDYYPDTFIAEDFIAQFPGYPESLKDAKILWPRTDYGRDFIADKLKDAGAELCIAPAYKTALPDNAKQISNELHKLLKEKKIDVISLASKQSAINLAQILGLANKKIESEKRQMNISQNSPLASTAHAHTIAFLKDTLQGILIVTIGPETSEGALNYLGKVDMQAKRHSAEGIIDVLIEHYKEGKQ